MRVLGLFVVAVTLGAVCIAHAQTEPDVNYVGPRWIQRPSAGNFDAFYPPLALEQGVVGRAHLVCSATLSLRPDCRVTQEWPEGWGFGDAALAISRSFQLVPAMRNGVYEEGGSIPVPINFAYPRPRRSAQEPQKGEDIDYSLPDLPLWEEAPSFAAVQAATPRAARGRRGRATLSCTVTPMRRLLCALVAEAPADLGLGDAALRLAPRFRVYAEDREFIEMHAREPFLLPINFNALPPDEPVSRFVNGVDPFEMLLQDPQFATYYPEAARSQGVTGSAVALCTMRSQVHPDCVIESETPSGHGFAEALLRYLTEGPAVTAEQMDMISGDRVRLRAPFPLNETPPAR